MPPKKPRPPYRHYNAGKQKKPESKIGGEQIEGRRAVLELLIAGTRRTKEIFLADNLTPSPILTDIETLASSENIPVQKVSKSRLDQISHTESPQGVVAKALPLKPCSLEDLASTKGAEGQAPFLLVLDGVIDTVNLGSLMRSAECAGATGIVMAKHRSARITPATAKTAAGAIEYLPISQVGGIPSALQKLKSLGVWTLGLDTSASKSLYDVAIAAEPIALVLGSESQGLKKLTKSTVDDLVSIPLQGKIGALNVAAAASVACFEIQRLRQAEQPAENRPHTTQK